MKELRKTEFRKTVWWLAIVGMVAVALATGARGSVLLYEGFDMGATAGSLTGKAGATSVGFATGSTWTDNSTHSEVPWGSANYQPTGLTFSDLPAIGGSASLTTSLDFFGQVRNDAARQLGFTATGTIYGSYLVRLGAPTSINTPDDISSIIVGSSSSYGAIIRVGEQWIAPA